MLNDEQKQQNEEQPLGILCVHGIGNQPKGSTLLDFSEPIYDWIERWTKAGDSTNQSGVEVLDTDLYPAGDDPAHTSWQIRVKQKNGKVKKEQWLLAEAWWAESFAEPGFSKPLLWTIKIGPWMIFSHFATLYRRIKDKDRPNYYGWLILTIINFAFYIPLAVLLMPLFQILALILLLLSYIPISSIQSFVVAPVRSVISNWIGDSYFLTTSPVRREAMISRVSRELRWLESRCSKVVIVAHSQGAAIMHEVLQKPSEKSGKSKRLLISLGSGLRLLSTIKYVDNDVFFQFVSIVSLLISPAFIYFLVEPASLPFLVSLLFLFGILLFIGYSVRTQSPIRTDPEKFGQTFQWLDLYASLDPASNGELFEREQDRPTFLQSSEVHNQASMFSDHTMYRQNRDEFITEVVRAVSDFSGLNLTSLTDGDAETIKGAKEQRARRVRWLSVSRSAALAVSMLILVLFYFRIVSSFVNNATVARINDVLKNIDALKGVLPYIRGEWLDLLIGTLALLSVPLLWYLVTKWVWNQWDRFETNLFFRREIGNVTWNWLSFLFHTVMVAGIFAMIVVLVPGWFEGVGKFAGAVLGDFISLTVLAFFPSVFIMQFRKASPDKGITLAVQASLLTGVVYALLNNLPQWTFPSVPVFCSGLIAIPFLVLLYDRFLAPRLAIQRRMQAFLERRASRSSPAAAGSSKDYAARLSSTWRRYVIFFVGVGLAIWTIFFHLDLRSNAVKAFTIFGLGLFLSFSINSLEGGDRDHISRVLAILGTVLVIIVACMAWSLTLVP